MKTKRLLAGLLTLVMLVGLLPTAALAARRDDDVVPMEAPVDETPAAALAAPVWEDAAASLSAGEVNLSDPKWSNLALDMIKNEGNTAVTFNPAGSGNWGSQLSYMTDGKYDTANAYTQSQVPTSFNSSSFDANFYVQFDLGENRTVGGFEFSVSQEEASHGFKYTIYGKAADGASWTKLTEDISISHAAGENIKQHPLSAETSLRYVRVVLHSGYGGAVGAFSEFKIFGLKPLDLSTLTNIASQATITHNTQNPSNPCDQSTWTDGDDATESGFYGDVLPSSGDDAHVELDFGENRKVGGIRLAAKPGGESHWYYCDVLTKGETDANWTTRVTNVPVKRIAGENVLQTAFTSLEDVRYVKFVLHQGGGGSWGAISEIGVFAPAPDPNAGRVNHAPQTEITVPSNEDQIGKIIDGNVGTWWAAGSGDWPANIDFALPGNLAVKRVELDFERFDGRTFNLSVSRAVNNVTSDYQQLISKNGHSANETFVYEMAEPQRMTHVRVSLLATNGQAWPGIAEVRIYAVDEKIDLDNYTNITPYADITTGDGYKEWDFHGNQQIAGFRATLPDGVTAVLKGKMKRGNSWTTYFTQLQNGDNVFDFLKGMSVVRLELSDPSQLSDLQIFGTYTAPIIDSGSIAFDIVPHTNYGSATAYLLTDGNTQQPWTAEMYPVYIDIDLEQNYNLSQIEVYAPENGQTEYTLYTSMDGSNFTIVDEAHTTGPRAGLNAHTLSNVEARVVRVYVEYYSQSASPSLNEIRVMGTPSGTTVQTAPAVTVEAFEDTEYAAPITNQDVYDEVKGIIRRQINEKNPNDVDYTQWFTLNLQPTAANGYDYFTLTDEGGKIKVTGNNGVSLATGINHYLKYFCNVHISQVGNQVNMPDAIVPIGGTVHKETKFPVRYAYNYCTHSYTMSFWNEPEWRNELDWQALNGVNVVLDITGQEEVWREFLMSVGYTHQEAKDFLAGPGYYAWAYMANLTGFGGPIHDSFLTQRVELGRKNQRIMRTLGMYPVLQAFSGMVPVDITDHDPNAAVIPQGGWCGFQRPTMLKTDTTTYDEYAAKFYAAQKRVFGDAKYYATDPFHEGGNTGDMSGTTVASSLLDSLLDFDSDAVWIIQCWQENPSNALLAGLGNRRTDHALVLDLYAEKTECWKGHHGRYESPDVVEFSDTPWVWCMLNNFGGRMGLHGHLDALQQNIPAAANSANHMAGVGMSPEGAQENPVLYDFLFETIWTNDASQALPTIDLDQWLRDYVLRRYGAQSDNAEAAMEILAQTVYKSSLNMTGQGSPESVVNARPALSIQAASTWGNSSINYSKGQLEKAAALLLEDYDTLSASDAYLYDVADVLKQVLSNTAQKVHSDMAAAYNSGNAAEFETQSDRFLALIDTLEEVLGTRSEFTFGKWTEGAELMAKNTDDFTERLYLRNAKALVTTWGSKEQNGGLKDYSNRQWAGLTNDYYKARWIIWIGQAKQNLANNNHNNFDNTFDWFAFEWAYARNHQLTYSSEPNGLDLKALGEEILTDYSVRDPLGEKDIDPATMTVKCGTEHYGSDEDDRAINVLDRDTGTIWHTEWTPSAAQSSWWIAFDLSAPYLVDGLRYLPRQGNNTTGRITGYEVYVSNSDTDWAGTTDTWQKATEGTGTWPNNSDWKLTSFTPTLARYVKLVVTSASHTYASASEIRVTGTIPVTDITLDQASLALYVNAGHANHTATLTAEVGPENAADKAVRWSTSDINVAAVNSTTGAVTAMGIGTATITATAHDGSGVTATCTVTVKKEIDGDVSVTGALKFGSTLTVNGAFDSDVLNNVTYTWYRGEGTSGTELGTGKTYTPVVADIGSKLTVKASATAGTLYTGEVTFTTATTVTKADGHKMLDADPAYENCSAEGVNDGKITGLRTDHVYQYQKQGDDGEWPTDEASWITVAANSTEITGLAPGSYRVRHIGDETRFPGEPSNTVTIVVEGGAEKKLTIPPRFEGGTVRANRSQIPAEDTVTLTVTPDTGYELATLVATYTDGDGVKQTLTPTLQSNGKYTFTMPAFPVDIAATFTKITYTIGHGLEHISCNEAEHQHTATYEVPFSIILTPDEGYNMPNTLTVTETGTTTKFTDFTYEVHATDPAKRVLTFPNGVTCNITVSGAATLKSYTIDHQLTDIACDMEGEEQHKVTHGAALTIQLTAGQGYYLPEEVTVTMSGQTFEGFTYTRTSDTEGQLTISANKITGPLVVSAAGVIPLTSVTVQGTAQVGQALTAQAYPTAAKVSYQWFRGETEIENATGKTYTLTDADLGATIKVQVTATGGYTGTKTSNSVGPVVPVPVEKAALQTAYDAAKDLEQGNYTDASWAAFEAAREQALAVLENADATQAEVDAAVKALTNAQKALKKPSTGTTTRPTTTTTETKEDGTKVTTETKPDGTKVETVEEPDGTKAVTETKKDGTVTETVEEPDGTKAVTETKPDGSKTATVEQPDGTKSETVVTAEGDATITVTDPDGEELAKVEIPATIPEPEDKFDDIDQTPWAEESINKVAGLELVKGIGGNKYDPTTPMTRGALATVLHRLSQGKTDYQIAFKDVQANRYYTEGVAWAAKAKVVTGYTAEIFAPDDIITREQLAVMMARYAKLIGMSTKADAKSLDAFVDGENTGAWAVDGVAWCVENGILRGKGLNNLDPTANVSRAEVAVMLDRFIALIQK